MKKYKSLFIVLLITFAIYLVFKYEFFSSIWWLLIIVFIVGGVFLYQNKKNHSENKDKSFFSSLNRGYIFFYKYIKAILYSITAIIIIVICTIFINKIMTDEYDLVISDLPISYVERGYTKEVLKEYLNKHISSIKNSDNQNSELSSNDDTPFIGVEVLGNKVYIDEFVLFFKKILNREQIIKLQFGKDTDDLFYQGSVKNKNKSITLNKQTSTDTLLDVFSDKNINDITKYAIRDVFKVVQFRKLISYYKENIEVLGQMKADNSYFESKADTEKAYFYTTYGHRFYDTGYYLKALDNYLIALELYERNEIDDERNYESLQEGIVMSHFMLGNSDKALSIINDKNLNDKTFKAIKGYILFALGKTNLAKKIFEESIKKDLFNNDSISPSLKMFDRNHIFKYLISLNLKEGKYKEVIKLSEQGFKAYSDNAFLEAKHEAQSFLGQNKQAYETSLKVENYKYNEISNSNIDYVFDEMVMSLLNETELDAMDLINIHNTKAPAELNTFESLYNSYPNNRIELSKMMDNQHPIELVKKAYQRYIVKNPTDINIKYNFFLYRRNFLDDESQNLIKDIDSVLKSRGILNENVYYYKKYIEYVNFKYKKDIGHHTKDSITYSFKDLLKKTRLNDSLRKNTFINTYIKKDTIYTSLKNKTYRNFIKFFEKSELDLKDDSYIDFVTFCDSLANESETKKRFFNKMSSLLLVSEVLEVYDTDKEEYLDNNIIIDSLLNESLKRDYTNKLTWLTLGTIKDELGFYEQANYKYNQVLDLDNDFNSYLYAAKIFNQKNEYYFREKKEYLAVFNYLKAFQVDKNAITNANINNCYKAILMSSYYNKITRDELSFYKKQLLEFQPSLNLREVELAREIFEKEAVFYANEYLNPWLGKRKHLDYHYFINLLKNFIDNGGQINNLPNNIQEGFSEDKEYIKLYEEWKIKSNVPIIYHKEILVN